MTDLTADLVDVHTPEGHGDLLVVAMNRPREGEESTDLVMINPESTIASANAEGKKMKKIIRKKRRPARPQVDPSTFKTEPPPQTGTIFNIWYNKWSGGDREDKYLSKTAAVSRCNVAKDTGYTRADSVSGSHFCLFFARGVCPRGRDCEYLHRLPSTYDVYSGNLDCFGRDKHSDYRDDMGGVGSFMRQNRTLYIGTFGCSSLCSNSHMLMPACRTNSSHGRHRGDSGSSFSGMGYN